MKIDPLPQLDSKKFGRRLRRDRIAAGISLSSAAKMLGVCRQTIYIWESGLHWPTVDKYVRLCALYGTHDGIEVNNESGDEPAVAVAQ